MRLLNLSTLELEDFMSNPPRYAVLSHTWTTDEITFQDLGRPNRDRKEGWKKILSFVSAIKSLCLPVEYCWVDTCCIDKVLPTSSHGRGGGSD